MIAFIIDYVAEKFGCNELTKKFIKEKILYV
jgi:hypothetical protein